MAYAEIFSFFISFFPSPLSSLAHFTQMGPKIVHTDDFRPGFACESYSIRGRVLFSERT